MSDAAAFVAPPEWVTHRRTWMSWIPDGYVREDADAPAAWGRVARAIAAFEPVTVLCPGEHLAEARTWCGPQVELVPCPVDDAWFRDDGPTFLLGRCGRLGAVLWSFNGWGGRIACADRQRTAARLAARRASATTFESALVNEGGAIAVDGAGTVLVTDTVQANPNRNPTWDRRSIEQELRARLGVGTVVWLARGLDGDGGANGTDGHVDTLAAFVRPGVLVVHHQPDPDHPDHAVMAENRARLSAARDHAGRRFELVELVAPVAGREGHASHESYVNFAWVNGGVVLCGFADAAADAAVHATFRRLLPERRITQIDASAIFRHGGGIHCITQPEPSVAARW